MSRQHPDGDPLTQMSNACGLGKDRDCQPICGSIACCERFDCQAQLYTLKRRTIASDDTSCWGVSNSGEIHDFDPCLWIAPLLDITAPVERSTVRGSVFSFDPRHDSRC